MLLMYKETVFSVSDLEQIVLKCSYCKTEIALNLKDAYPSEADYRRTPLILSCPICTNRFDSKIEE